MTWTGKTFNVGDILTAAQMNNLQADITAQAQGDAGAPPQAVVTLTTSTEVGSASVAGTYPLPNGLVTVSATGDDGTAEATIDVNINGTYRPAGSLTGTGSIGGTFLVVNSGDLRINRTAGTISTYWQRFI